MVMDLFVLQAIYRLDKRETIEKALKSITTQLYSITLMYPSVKFVFYDKAVIKKDARLSVTKFVLLKHIQRTCRVRENR